MTDTSSAVPSPWDLTDPYRRGEVVRAQAHGPEQIADALSALELLARRVASRARVDQGAVLGSDLAEDWGFTAVRIAEDIPRLADYSPEAVTAWLKRHGLDLDGPAIAEVWLDTVESRSAYDAAYWLSVVAETVPEVRPALADIKNRYAERLPGWVADAVRRASAPFGSTRIFISRTTDGLQTDALRSWMDRLSEAGILVWEDGNSYEVADAVAAGKSVTGSMGSPGGPAHPVTFSSASDGLSVDLNGSASDDWLSTVVTDAGRMLRADAVLLTDDPDAEPRALLDAARSTGEIPHMLWVSSAETGRYERAQEHATRSERQWDGALLLVR